MDKQSAVNLIKKTFKNPFEKGRYIDFVKNLFNKISLEPFEYSGQLIPDSFKPYINKYERVGKYTAEDKRIDILIVYLNKETSIERARTMQRNFVAGYLTGKYGSASEKDAAVVAFVSPGLEDWRFSLVKMEYKLSQTATGRPKGEEEFTPARRYSFLVGINEPNHTAQQQLLPILQDDVNNPTLDQLEKAFNVEKVAREFFNKYRDLYLKLKSSIEEIVKTNEIVREEFEKKKVNTVDFSKKLLGQIVFLYFLQKKGWLGVPKDKNWGEGDKSFLRSLFTKYIANQTSVSPNFFNDYLEFLFYDTLNNPRTNQVDQTYSERFDCRIPFLNGGLFEPINNYDWKNTNIIIPNELFSNAEKTEEGDTGSGILDVFDRYNFTVQEDEPLEKEVALDPELLGKIFENLIEENLRKGQGAYYTPREIVHYMCQESLINYLSTELNAVDDKLSNDTADAQENQIPDTVEDKITKTDIEIFIKYGEHLIENEKTALQKDQDIKSGKQKSTSIKSKMPESIKNNAKLIDEKLANIRVCDPAVGSGAFPVGMMLEIVKARNVLTNYLPNEHGRTAYNFKRHCIENCLYGVDIDSSAIDIAKLRFWLSLVVDEEDVTKIKPLPNLDYKLVCGNSLLGVEKDLFNAQLFSQLEELKQKYFNETDTDKKIKLKKQIDNLIKQITNNDEHFDFEIYFSEVFHQKKGFDVVIANPPYLGEKGHKNIFQMITRSEFGKIFYVRRMDILYFFFHKALDLARESGSIAFITTNYYLTATSASKLRKDFKERAIIKKLINLNTLTIFENARGQHDMITVLIKGRNDNETAETCITKREGLIKQDIFGYILAGQDDQTLYFKVKQSDLYEGSENYIRLERSANSGQNLQENVLEKVKNQGELLGTICNVNQGIVTGADKVKPKHIKKYGIDASIGDGIFVLHKNELTKKSIKKDSIHIKPWFKNSHIQKYRTILKNNFFVLYFKDRKERQDIEIEVLKHFEPFKKLLIDRLSVCKNNQFQWKIVSKWIDRGEYYLLFYPRKQEIFEGPKIVAPQRSPRNTFGYNEIPWYASADVYFITEKDKSISLKYLCALLNSKLYYIWLYYRGKRKGEMLELYQKPLSEIPIKKISQSEQQPFIDIVDKILAITKDEDYLENPSKQAKVKEYERQIDQMVYKLYGLTEDEIKIVENSINE